MVNYKIKDINTSLILCIFGGWFGLHHFYNKQIGKGLLYLFTFGLFYVGWIMDIIKLTKTKNTNAIQNNTGFERYCVNCGKRVEYDENFCKQCGYNLNSYKSEKDENHTNNNKNNNTNDILYEKTFNVAGISFHNKELKKIIKNGIETGNIEKFQGMDRKEKVEYCEYNNGLGEYSEQQINVKLNKTNFDNKPAIEVLADDFYGNKILIGYVPKNEINELLQFIDKKILIWANIVGGKIYYFDEDKENDEYDELELGVNLLIKIYDK